MLWLMSVHVLHQAALGIEDPFLDLSCVLDSDAVMVVIMIHEGGPCLMYDSDARRPCKPISGPCKAPISTHTVETWTLLDKDQEWATGDYQFSIS